MPDIGLSSANEACDVKSLRGIQYLHDGQHPQKEASGRLMGKHGDHEKPSRSRKVGESVEDSNRHTEERTYAPA